MQTRVWVGGRLSRFRVLLLLPIAYLLVLALMMLFEESLIFMPAKYPRGQLASAGSGGRRRLVRGRWAQTCTVGMSTWRNRGPWC